MNAELRDHFVYRAYDAEGRLLYIGCTKNPGNRFRAHRSTKPWGHEIASWRMQGPFTKAIARARGRSAQIAERPLYGLTPVRQSAVVRKRNWISHRIRDLIAEGVGAWEALDRAVDEAGSMDWGAPTCIYDADLAGAVA